MVRMGVASSCRCWWRNRPHGVRDGHPRERRRVPRDRQSSCAVCETLKRYVAGGWKPVEDDIAVGPGELPSRHEVLDVLPCLRDNVNQVVRHRMSMSEKRESRYGQIYGGHLAPAITTYGDVGLHGRAEVVQRRFPSHICRWYQRRHQEHGGLPRSACSFMAGSWLGG